MEELGGPGPRPPPPAELSMQEALCRPDWTLAATAQAQGAHPRTGPVRVPMSQPLMACEVAGQLSRPL